MDLTVNLDAATLNKRLSAAYQVGTTPRYADFDQKTANKTLMMNDGVVGPGGQSATPTSYPTPYATLPMGAMGEVSLFATIFSPYSFTIQTVS